jgi:hypothetical protein
LLTTMFRFISYLVVFFDAGQGDCGVRKGIGVSAAGSLLFYFCRQIPRVICWYLCWYRQQSTTKVVSDSNGYGSRQLSARGTNRASALIRQRSFSSITTAISRIFDFADVRPNFMVSGDFHGIFHGRSFGSWYRDFWVESNRCRSRTTPIFGT